METFNSASPVFTLQSSCFVAGHQKKIMLAIERLKKITKRQSQGSTPITGSAPRWSADMASNSGFSYSDSAYRSGSGDNISLRDSLSVAKSINDSLYSRYISHLKAPNG